MLKEKKRFLRSEKYRRFIASLPCAVTGSIGNSQCAHIRSGVYAMGMKPSDSLCLPLHWREHKRQHDIGEVKFYEPYGGVENAKTLARILSENWENEEFCILMMNKFRLGIILR